MLAGSEDCSLWMWNADKGVYLNMFSGHNQGVTCGDFTPDGKKKWKTLVPKLTSWVGCVIKHFTCDSEHCR